MLILLSPAKTLDFESAPKRKRTTVPRLMSQTADLVAELKALSQSDIASLMGVSDKLAQLNFDRFQDFEVPLPKAGTRPAIDAFQGDVYTGLRAESFTDKQVAYAQAHLRILSGLYGILRPLDRMLPYRLEMGTRLKTPQGKDLYAFWGDHLRELLQDDLEAAGGKTILNLASKEYSKAVRLDHWAKQNPGLKVISPTFKERRGGELKQITLFAKQARGLMAAWAIRQKAKSPAKLTRFDTEGYQFAPELSSTDRPVFVRG
ncbi:MAG: peroxide stress protein YaaA [Planctomycetota bacterium]